LDGKTFIFEKAPVPRAVMELVIPTIISQLITMIYNMADTFFVGQLNDPNQVAAVTLAAPVMLVLTALANLFGIGGASLLSRSLGEKNYQKARQATTFGFYAALAVALCGSLAVLFFKESFLNLLGATGGPREFTGNYLFWVFIIGGAPTLLGMVLAHFVRADGAPRQASLGLSMGGVLNMVLDPLFIFPWGFGLGVTGAAIATLIANLATLVYFFNYFYRKRKTTTISLNPRNLILHKEISLAVLVIGLPAMLQTLLAAVSNAVLNILASPYGGSALAAFGVAKKVDTIPMSITIGLAQGVLPLLGYNFSAKNIERMQKAFRFTLSLAVGFSLFCVIVFEIFAPQIVRLFIAEAATVAYGSVFLRVMCICTPLMAVAFLMITLFQAAGEGKPALILSVFRKGLIDIPLMLLMNFLIPLYGLAGVQPITEGVAMGTALFFYYKFSRRYQSLNKSVAK